MYIYMYIHHYIHFNVRLENLVHSRGYMRDVNLLTKQFGLLLVALIASPQGIPFILNSSSTKYPLLLNV